MKFKLITCPRQPGNLRISKKACALRYREAQQISGEIPVREFDVVRKIGLETCKTCPVGKDNAAELHLSNRKNDEAALTSVCINRALKENRGGKTDHGTQ